MCLGTWMGFAVSLILYTVGMGQYTPMGLPGDHIYLMVFLNGLVATAGVWLFNTLQDALERGFHKD